MIVNLLMLPYDLSHPDQVVEVVFLLIAAAALSLPQVRLDRGYLTLTGVAIGAAGILTNPLDATLIGLGMAVAHASRGFRAILANGVSYAAIACLTAMVASSFRAGDSLP